jgi:hypothetical protein
MFESDSRQRMISLRVSEAEYKVLKAEYKKYGLASVSDLARLAIRQLIEVASTEQDVGARINLVEARLNILEARVLDHEFSAVAR